MLSSSLDGQFLFVCYFSCTEDDNAAITNLFDDIEYENQFTISIDFVLFELVLLLCRETVKERVVGEEK